MRSKDDADARSLLIDQAGKHPTAESGQWRSAFPEIVGRSPAMARVLETVYKIARADSSVLILGESGTGKELIAAAIHRLSQRSDRPYVTINSSAIPENLLESELFGHERGAYTGADRRRPGRFEDAAGGTLFLDEIGDMPLSLQAKLLRVLQDKRYSPLGGNEVKEADVRIIAATNMDLISAISRGAFRRDLYYRLNVLPIQIPALRERREDIPDLLEHFVEVGNRMQTLSSPCFLTDDLIQFLAGCQWPGNVRQLQNLVERLVVMKGGGAIGLQDLPVEVAQRLDEGVPAPTTQSHYAINLPAPDAPHAASNAPKSRGPLGTAIRYPANFGKLPEEGLDLVRLVEDLENDLIKQALERTNNNRNQAAKLLGLNRTTLVERIKKRKLTPLNEPSKEL